MTKWITVAALAAIVAGCSDASQPLASDAAAPARPRLAAWGVDNDGDFLDDGIEDELANRFAPVLYMPNLITRTEAGNGVWGDWAWPANVDWYLQNTQLRFHHDNCPDHQILNLGTITTTNLIAQKHQRATSWLGCSHSGTTYYSNGGGGWSSENHFFLQAVYDDVTHPGVRDASGWKTYVHAFPNNLGGVSIQYWFFYAYNDFIAGFNHEADWEHVTVQLDANYNATGVWYSQHHTQAWRDYYQVTWYGVTHPQVWVADGSHASYPSQAECDNAYPEGTRESCWSNLDQRWFTWSGGLGGDRGLQGGGLVNMGEMPQTYTNKRPMPGQDWIKYIGRWGEEGNIDDTSGPQGPTYQANWTQQ